MSVAFFRLPYGSVHDAGCVIRVLGTQNDVGARVLSLGRGATSVLCLRVQESYAEDETLKGAL
jgi:hypothetical protein